MVDIRLLIGTWDVNTSVAGRKEIKVKNWLEYTFHEDGTVNEVGTKDGQRMTDKINRSWKMEHGRITLYQEKKLLMHVLQLTKTLLVLSTEKGDLVYHCKRK